MCNLRFIPFFPGNGQLGGVFAWHWSPRWGVFPPCDDDDDFSRLLREKVGAFKIQLGDEVLEVIIFLNKQFRKNGLYNILHQPEFCGVFFPSMSRLVVGFGNVFMDIYGHARMPSPPPRKKGQV